MKSHFRPFIAIALIATLLLVKSPVSRADPPPAADQTSENGITVMARGPVHEAFAQPVNPSPAATPIIPKKPPEPIPELPPDQKPAGDNVQWIPGYWSWDSDKNDFLWVSGAWRVPPQGRKWVTGHWSEAADGWQWSPGLWAEAGQTALQYQPQPPASVDNGPNTPAPDENSVYAPGSWVYRQSQYNWQPGSWLAARQGAVWVPAHYVYSPAGYVYVAGYWDYPLEDRGLLFAPVYFDQPVYTATSYYYRPAYAVDLAGLIASLFVRPACYSYYFGDYYDPGYANVGYYPWCYYGPRWYDPLFNYYRWHYRPYSWWYPGLVNVFQGRLHGSLFRPPHTFAAHDRFFGRDARERFVLNNRTNAFRTINNGNLALVKMVTPLNHLRQVDGRNITFNRLSSTQLANVRSSTNQFRQLAVTRTQTEHSGRITHGVSGAHVASPVSPATNFRTETRHFAAPGGVNPRPLSVPHSAAHVVSPTVHTPARVHTPASVHTPAHVTSQHVHAAAHARAAPQHIHATPSRHSAPPSFHHSAPAHSSGGGGGGRGGGGHSSGGGNNHHHK